MANQLGTNPIVVDTLSASAVIESPLNITRFEFTGYTTVSHAVVVQDKNGKILWSARGNPNFQSVVWEGSLRSNGLLVPTLDSGKLLINRL